MIRGVKKKDEFINSKKNPHDICRNLAEIKYSYVYIAINALILDKRTRIPFRMCRIGTDVITTAAGFFMGAVVGAGTLVTAFFMGPLIEFFNRTVARPFLYGKENKQMQKQ